MFCHSDQGLLAGCITAIQNRIINPVGSVKLDVSMQERKRIFSTVISNSGLFQSIGSGKFRAVLSGSVIFVPQNGPNLARPGLLGSLIRSFVLFVSGSKLFQSVVSRSAFYPARSAFTRGCIHEAKRHVKSKFSETNFKQYHLFLI